jgi:hypothetical protein
MVEKFGPDHPYIYSEKFKEYCQSREMDCLDYYHEGFKEHDADELSLSYLDRHINEVGAQLTAEILFEKLKILKNYQNISKFHNAFTLRELLNEKNAIKKVDQTFSELNKDKTEISLNLGYKNLIIRKFGNQYELEKTVDELSLEKNGNKLFLQKSFFGPFGKNLKLISKTILDFRGHISKIEKSFLDITTNEKTNWEIFQNFSSHSILTTGKIKKTKSGISKKEEIKRKFFFL